MVTLEGIFLWTNHPYHEAQGLVRKRVGHWTILRAVETPVPDSKSNPIQSYRFYTILSDHLGISFGNHSFHCQGVNVCPEIWQSFFVLFVAEINKLWSWLSNCEYFCKFLQTSCYSICQISKNGPRVHTNPIIIALIGMGWSKDRPAQ